MTDDEKRVSAEVHQLEPTDTNITSDTLANDFAGGDGKLYKEGDPEINDLGRIDTDDRSLIVDDEAETILGKHLSHVQTTPLTRKEQKKTLWKIDWRVTFPMFMTITVMFYDKSMVGQAAIYGMIQDLGLYTISNGTVKLTPYQNGVMLYFIAGIFSMYPFGILAQKYDSRYVIAFCVLCFGIIQLCAAGMQNSAGFMATKFLLGVFGEPMLGLFLAQSPSWFTQREQVWRLGLWFSGASASVILCGAINLACTHIGGSLETWRWFYIMAGIISLLWGIAICFMAPDHPTRVKWLDERQRFWAIDRLKKNNQGIINRRIKWDHIKEALTSFELYLLFIMITAQYVLNGGVNTFGGLITSSLGFSKSKSLCYIMAAGFSGMVSILISAMIAWVVPGTRLLMCILICILSSAGAIMLWKTPIDEKTQLLWGFWLLVTHGGAELQIVAIMGSNVAGSTKRSFFAGAASIGQSVGNIIGPYLFQTSQKPHYPLGYKGIIVCMAINIGGSIILYIYWRIVNFRRDKKYGKPKTKEAFSDMTDKQNRDFRYTV